MIAEKNTEQAIRLALVMIIIGVGFGYVVHNLWQIQVVRYPELSEKARSKYTTSVVKYGRRGSILDANGTILAGDAPYFSLQADPCNFPLAVEKCPHLDPFKDERLCPICPRSERTILRAANFLAQNLGLNRDEMVRLLSETTREGVNDFGEKVLLPKRYVMVTKKIEFEDGRRLAEKMKETVKRNQANLSNKKDRDREDFSRVFTFNTHYARMYPRENMLANILGFVNVDTSVAAGVSGIERSINPTLRPHDGRHTYEKMRRGATIGYDNSVNEYDAPIQGCDVYLTIQEPIQSIVEEELDRVVEKYKPKLAYCVVVDPRSGDIMAMAQRPSFNPNDRNTFFGENTRNLMAENVFEPGSIMKPIPISYAMDRGVISPRSTIFCENGKWFYGGFPLRDTSKHGVMSIAQIIQLSSNIGTAKIALELGSESLYQCFQTFGFGSKTNLPVRPESRGILPRLSRWSKVSPTRLAIGQGIAVTPFQIVRAYSALANKGLLPQLRLISHTVKYDEFGKGTRIDNPVLPPTQLFKHPETIANSITQMMKLVCTPKGTAKRAAIPGYYSAGKTGTAQKVINGQYSYSKHIASFAGFAPADNPRFVMLVSVDEPQGIYYGGIVAAPVFAAAGERILKYLGVKPDYVLGSDLDPDDKRRADIARKGNHKESTRVSGPATVSIANPFPEKLRDPDDIWTDDITGRTAAPDLSPSATFDDDDLDFMKRSEMDLQRILELPTSDITPPLRLRE